MLRFKDFPDIVAGVEVEPALTWDFTLPAGTYLIGTPSVEISVSGSSSGQDPDVLTRIGTPSIITGVDAFGNPTQANCAVAVSFGPTIPLATVSYLFVVSCPRSDQPGVAACFNHILARAPY